MDNSRICRSCMKKPLIELTVLTKISSLKSVHKMFVTKKGKSWEKVKLLKHDLDNINQESKEGSSFCCISTIFLFN